MQATGGVFTSLNSEFRHGWSNTILIISSLLGKIWPLGVAYLTFTFERKKMLPTPKGFKKSPEK